MRVLITGVAGHLGSALARWLVKNRPGVAIVGVDNLATGFEDSIPDSVDFHKCDIREWRLWPRFGFDVIYHFAAFAAEVLSPRVRCHTVRNVFEATCAVLNGHRGCGRIVFASSIAVYGRGINPHDEASECRPIDTYGNCKLACEREVHNSGLNHCIVRPHNIYGVGQNLWDDSRNVFGIWMRQALERQPLRVYGDGSQRRAFTYIDDVLEPLWFAGTAPQAAGEIINIGGAVPTTIMDAALLTAEITGATGIAYQPERHEVKDAWATVEKSQRLLGYRDRTPLALGLGCMWQAAQIAWQAHPERRRSYEPPIES